MRPHVLSTYAESLAQAHTLVGDVPDERFAEVPHPGAKHPGWVLGHLCVASGLGAAALGDDPAEMQTLCGVPTEVPSTRTPHMYIIDDGGKLVYIGAIDDDPRGNQGEPATNYVAAALDEVLAGKAVTTAETKSYGCSVKYKTN